MSTLPKYVKKPIDHSKSVGEVLFGESPRPPEVVEYLRYSAFLLARIKEKEDKMELVSGVKPGTKPLEID